MGEEPARRPQKNKCPERSLSAQVGGGAGLLEELAGGGRGGGVSHCGHRMMEKEGV